MTEFDISHMMFTYDQYPHRGRKYATFENMMEWVETHIGPMIERNGFTSDIMRKGAGWEIRTIKRGSQGRERFKVISWRICIDDENLATMFALKWIE